MTDDIEAGLPTLNLGYLERMKVKSEEIVFPSTSDDEEIAYQKHINSDESYISPE